MSQHTPGPWITFNEPNGTISINMAADSGGTCGPQIATVLTENLDADSRGQGIADARLIAAAPTLLAVLIELVDSPNAKQNDLWDRARAAIDLAEAPEGRNV